MPSRTFRLCYLVFLPIIATCAVVAQPSSLPVELEIRNSPTAQADTNLATLAAGNASFRRKIARTDPGLLTNLTVGGQHPPFMYLGCSDSRVSEGTIFDAKPGQLFPQRNIANQFLSNDNNVQSVLAYAVADLGVSHVIVMGHYGCGGVAAAIASPPSPPIDDANGAVQNWITPIRQLYLTSNRSEIVELRKKNEQLQHVDAPGFKDVGYRALIEENVKLNVRLIADSSVIRNHYAALSDSRDNVTAATEHHAVFIHGFIYDISTGYVYNLGVSVGPPGVSIPRVPFPKVSAFGLSDNAGPAHG